jgi:hypothetical protein
MARSRTALALVALTGMSATPVYAQIDPLLFIKDTAPHIIFAVDTSPRMQRDAPVNPTDTATANATSFYYDPVEYKTTGASWQQTLGIPAGATTYRRKYYGLSYAGVDATAASIRIVTNENVSIDTAPLPSPAGMASYSLFEAPARLALARAAISQAIAMTADDAQFGLVKMRQTTPAAAVEGNTTPINLPAALPPTEAPDTENGRSATWRMSRPTVGATDNGSTGAANRPALVESDRERSNEDLLALLGKGPRNGGLIPAGNETAATRDAPINNLLLDARAEAARIIENDADCTNTIVVLIAGGGEGTTSGIVDAATTLSATASGFLNVRSGRRVPIYVVAIAPPATDVVQLRTIAETSGGQYVEIIKAQIDAALASPGVYPSPIAGAVVVPEMVAAINTAVQHGFADFRDVNTAPTGILPFGPSSEFQVTSPIVGSVNLDYAKDIGGASLPNTVVLDKSDHVIRQRSNVMLTTAFMLPGARASLRAVRQFKPVADVSQPSGYRFSVDGTPLWVAKVPGDAARRNLYTATAQGAIIPFDTIDAGNLAVLARLMNMSVADATAVITAVRGTPLGAILDSTPAIMDPPSLDPPPDDDYARFLRANKDRRTIVWVGSNAGILEGIDARLGIEAWGFIPLNLLPKLKTLRLGQGLTKFQYFVDASARVADVKVDGRWRTHLVVGEGPGGTFYQSFDVTLDDMFSSGLRADDDSIEHVLAYFADPRRIAFNWAFPRYSSFDPMLSTYDGNVDATVAIGDLAPVASEFEKSVGQTWSHPSIRQVSSAAGPYAVFVGSGFLPYTTQRQANRNGAVAGTTFYVLSARDGTLYDSIDVGSDGRNETIDSCSQHLLEGETTHRGKKKRLYACVRMKNALQSAPSTTGPANSRFVTSSYLGDLDGMVWRVDVDLDAINQPRIKGFRKVWESGEDQPIFSSMATVRVGSVHQYVFYGTGSDLLPSTDIATTYHMLGVLDDSGPNAVKPGTHPPRPAAGDKAGTAGFDRKLKKTADTKDDEKVDNTDTPLVKSIAGQRATAPFVVDQHLMFGTTSKVALFGDPDDFNNGVGHAGVRVLSWREVR